MGLITRRSAWVCVLVFNHLIMIARRLWRQQHGRRNRGDLTCLLQTARQARSQQRSISGVCELLINLKKR
jgi:hypothetical protein